MLVQSAPPATRVVRGVLVVTALFGITATAVECALDPSRDAPPDDRAQTASIAPRSRAAACMPRSINVGLAGPQTSQALDYTTYACGCPSLVNTHTGGIGRLFAGGDPASNTDRVIVEDAVNGDAYEWRGVGATSPNDWLRIGGNARQYAYGTVQGTTSLYRLSGDGREEKQALAAGHNGDQWDRIGKGVATGIFTSNGGLYTDGFLGTAFTLWQLTDASSQWWTEVDGPVNAGRATTYAVSDSGIYKVGQFGTSAPATYARTSGSAWTLIGPATTNVYAAGGTVFGKTSTANASTVTRYLGTPNAWRDVSPGGVVTKIVGTPSTAFALIAGNVAQLALATNVWTTVRSAGDVRDIASGGGSLFAMTSAGRVVRYASGAWSDVTCAGSASSVGCANTCDPGPDVTRSLPTYSDAAWSAQTAPANAHHDVLTQHNDAARTGAMTYEDVLTPASVSAPGKFRRLGKVTDLPGRIVAQPLYVEQAAVVCSDAAGVVANRDIAYVVTLENRVAAIDLNLKNLKTCWVTAALGCPQLTGAANCSETDKDGSCLGLLAMGAQNDMRIGIVSTPVIDVNKSVMYVVARVRDGSDARGRYYVNAIATRTGDVVARTEIIGDGLNGRHDCGDDGFRPSLHNNRAGLLLTGNTLFVAFSGSAGEDPASRYHGHVMAFDVSNPSSIVERSTSFCSTPTTSGAGIWMSGGGVASDGLGAFFTTGNGAYKHAPIDDAGDLDIADAAAAIPDIPNAGEYPESLVRIDVASLDATGYTDHRKPGENGLSSTYVISDGVRTRSILWGRERSDADYGSGGVAVIGHAVIGGGKDGILYALDTRQMGQPNQQPINAFQAFMDVGSPTNGLDFRTPYLGGPHQHGGPAIWNRSSSSDPDAYVYAWAEKDHLRMFRYNTVAERFEPGDAVDVSAANPLPVAHSDIVSREESMPGGMLSISSNGAQNGIVWATVEEPFKECTQTPHTRDGDAGTPTNAFHCNVLYGEVQGRLFAFDAQPDAMNRLRLLWGDTSAATPNNAIPRYAKNAPPTIAHGRVLVPTLAGELLVYGVDPAAAAPKKVYPGLAAAWNNGGNTSVAVYASNGAGLTGWSQWMTSTGWDPTSIWMSGDFNGDGLADVATAWNNGALHSTTIALRTSTGTSFTGSTLFASTIPWDVSTSWLPGDFDGDGRSDVAAAYNCNGSTCVTVWGSTSVIPGDKNIPSGGTPWIQTAGWDPSARWVAGDFDGDGKTDLATVWNSGESTIAMRRSTGNTFTLGTWLPHAGGWATSTQWFAGDFDGNGLTDLAAVWNNGNNTSVAVYPSNGQSFIGWTQWLITAGWDPNAQWLVGDFNGDGATDLLDNWANTNNVNTMAIRLSTRSGFTLGTWMQNGGGFSTTTRWVAGRFQ